MSENFSRLELEQRDGSLEGEAAPDVEPDQVENILSHRDGVAPATSDQSKQQPLDGYPAPDITPEEFDSLVRLQLFREKERKRLEKLGRTLNKTFQKSTQKNLPPNEMFQPEVNKPKNAPKNEELLAQEIESFNRELDQLLVEYESSIVFDIIEILEKRLIQRYTLRINGDTQSVDTRSTVLPIPSKKQFFKTKVEQMILGKKQRGIITEEVAQALVNGWEKKQTELDKKFCVSLSTQVEDTIPLGRFSPRIQIAEIKPEVLTAFFPLTLDEVKDRARLIADLNSVWPAHFFPNISEDARETIKDYEYWQEKEKSILSFLTKNGVTIKGGQSAFSSFTTEGELIFPVRSTDGLLKKWE